MDQNKIEACLWGLFFWVGSAIFMAFAAPLPPTTATGVEIVARATIYVLSTGVLAVLFGGAMLLLINHRRKN